LSDVARNFSHYLWALLRAAVIGIVGAWAIASILLTIQIGIHWADVTDVYQRLDAGIFGGLVITVLQILVLPNVSAWTISYLTCALFSFVTTIVSPVVTISGPKPALPFLAALPQDQHLQAHWWVLLLLLLAGVVAGWWFFEEGENHVEDFIIAKIPNHPTAITIAVEIGRASCREKGQMCEVGRVYSNKRT